VLPSPLELEPADLPPTGISYVILKSNCRSSYVITFFFVLITAAVLAEICSALPAAGSIYLYPSTIEMN
jgi:amino acid transporter